MKYDASGQKPASANGFDPGVEVRYIRNDHLGRVIETNMGKFHNRVRVRFLHSSAEIVQTALEIT